MAEGQSHIILSGRFLDGLLLWLWIIVGIMIVVWLLPPAISNFFASTISADMGNTILTALVFGTTSYRIGRRWGHTIVHFAICHVIILVLAWIGNPSLGLTKSVLYFGPLFYLILVPLRILWDHVRPINPGGRRKLKPINKTA